MPEEITRSWPVPSRVSAAPRVTVPEDLLIVHVPSGSPSVEVVIDCALVPLKVRDSVPVMLPVPAAAWLVTKFHSVVTEPGPFKVRPFPSASVVIVRSPVAVSVVPESMV